MNSFGVQDDFMYQYALPILNERAGTGNPFFSVLLSISNHPPYVIPPYFHPHSDVLEEQIVEYADWSIRQFMQAAENSRGLTIRFSFFWAIMAKWWEHLNVKCPSLITIFL